MRVIFFDAAGTLIHLPKGVGWHYRDIALRHGLDAPEEALNRAFRNAWKAMPAPAETRIAREDDDKGWWRDLVWRVLDGFPAAGGGFNRAAYFEELYLEFIKPGIWELYPEVSDTLRRLSGEYQLGVLSNFDGRLRIILQHLGISDAFQHWAISSEVGADKPSRWIFQRALAMAGASP